MNELAMTLCTLAAAASGGAITWTFLRFVFNTGWELREICAVCAQRTARCMLQRDDEHSTTILCGRCFHTALMARAFAARPRGNDKGATSQGISGEPFPVYPEARGKG